MGSISYIDLGIYSLFAVAAIGFIFAQIRVNKTKTELASSERLRSELAQGEKRMLDFLHHLGLSIDKENTHTKLYKVIVEGVNTVTKSRGAALYLIDKTGEELKPVYISVGCSQLIPDPPSTDPEELKKLVNTTSVNRHEGVLGHCLNNNAPFLIDNLRAHSAFQDQMVNYSSSGAAMIAPLIHAGKQIGVLAVTKASAKGAYTIDDLFTFSSIAEQTAFAIGNFDAHHQAAEKKRIETELQSAQEVQRVLIPDSAPEVPGFRIYGYNLAAQLISGDYYDYTNVNENTTGVVIADVSGKGVPAGLIMATFRSSLKAIASEDSSPAGSLSSLNKLIYPDIREDMFISAVYSHIDHSSGKITLARAGHNPPYHYNAEQNSLSKIKPPGLAVGIDTGNVFSKILKDHEISMKTGDTLLLYTDGIIEANNEEGDEYSSERLEETLKNHVTKGASTLAQAILDDVAAFVGEAPQSDDITLVAIEKI